MRRFLSPSGTSPETIRWARPSTIAVLPTPGSPISTGLFLVRRERIWMTRRISSSRPITGSTLPAAASLSQVAAIFFQRLIGRLGIRRGHALVAADLLQHAHQLVDGQAGFAQDLAQSRPDSSSIAIRTCSIETYSSLSFPASCSARASTRFSR